MIKKEFLIALSVSALLLGGCVDSSTGASARADMEGGEAHKTEKKVEAPKAEVKHAQKIVQKVEEKKAEAPAPKTEAKQSGVDTTACAGCHGADFEKKAMGVSKVVKDMAKDDIVKALKGYKDGSYGGNMKTLMKGQVASLDDAKIEAIANKIAGGGDKAPAPKVEEKKAEAPAPKAEEKKAEEAPKTEEKLVAVDTTACAGCHGANFEKKAMGVSKVVKDLTKDEIIKALKGYKDGSYGGAMKGVMKGQAMPLDDTKIEAIANKIGK
jgi:cytochrome c553